MRDFNHTVNVLVKAYFEGELEHGDCAKCAVGNIVHEATELPYGDEHSCITGTSAIWKALFFTYQGTQLKAQIGYEKERKPAIAAIKMTGYTVKELARVEFAFETAEGENSSPDNWMFNGLMAVVDVLADIHKIDLTTKEEAKKLFVKV